MSSFVDPYFLYIKERITFYPWLLMPLVLFIIGHGPSDYNYEVLYSLLWGIFFFRIFDDYFSLAYDRKGNKTHSYLKESSNSNILTLLLIFGLLYSTSLILIFGMSLTMLNFMLIGVSALLYRLLASRKEVLLISLLKYPLILFMVASYSEDSHYLWVWVGSSFFIVREVLEEFFGVRKKMIELCVVALILIGKLILRNI